jgi:hypothetical protein
MGTRNLTKVINKDGVTVVAQYGQWDGYPSGQGLTALYHAHNAKMIEDNLYRVRFLTDVECDEINASVDPSVDFVKQYPTLSRDVCADILGYVAYATDTVGLVDSNEFENDELFCEGIYTLDFQKRKFISTFGKTVEFDLDNLPSKQEYLGAWE